MKSFMQTEKGLVCSDPTSGRNVTMAHFARLSVLVAESDATLRGATLELVRQLGVHEVVQSESLGQAVELLRARAFDILLASESLAGGSGLELIAAAERASPATRSILIRAEGESAELPPGMEALRRPVSTEELRAVLQPVAAPAGGLWCEVPQLSLVDILQMYHQGRRSISVMISGPIAGRVRLEEGEIVDAQTEDLRGLPALSRLLEAESGLLRTEVPAPDSTRTISGPFQFLILHSAQRLDERRRVSSPGLPADPTLNVSNEQFPMLEEEPSKEPELQPQAFAAPSPGPARGNWLVIVAALVAVAAFALSVRSYLTHRADSLADASRRSASLGLSVQERQPEPAPAPSAPATPALPPARLAESPAALPSAPSGAEGLEVPGASPESVAKPADAPAAAQASDNPPSFELNIISKPARATVLENHQVLGKTPLRLKLDNASLASGPRELVVQHNGYHAHKISLSQSKADVRVVAVLTPRAPARDAASEPVPEEDQGATPDGRNDRSRPKRSDLGIRLRR
jgi:CheY-like chemotaxis protein